ncbi:hypothetical protein QWY28_10575 [Nocardioides sp. SOB77]|uniref:Sulfotransferase family protein n=1 Tax=Nocardioides oceani TaxID=3058369 RepID=A0ABT8FFB6_9ACTN|nr:hypothetical protein [Nocardioides oceani]MDN4173389.1 hypothetical protein [Nocardioides oceani]
MDRRDAFLHLGPSRLGTELVGELLDDRRGALAAAGVRRAGTPDAAFRAAVELARDHRAWGFRRAEVEGAWAGVCRESRRHRRSTRAVVVSERLLAGLTRPQVDLLLDQLVGFRAHVVLTVTAPEPHCHAGDPATDLVDVLDRWAPAVGDPARVHVLVVPRGPRPVARDGVRAAFGAVVGADPAARATRSGLRPEHGPLGAPAAAASAAGGEEEHARLTGLALTWIGALATSGHDVHGDLADLLPGASVRLPGVLVGGA